MKTLLVYSSLTGNTKKVAESIFEILPKGAEKYAIENAPDPQNYDLILVGYWVDKGTADKRSLQYIESIKGKKIIAFGTLGAYSDSEHAQNCLSRIRELFNENEFIGDFLCQGAVDPNLTIKFLHFPKDHPHALNEQRLRRHLESQKHPNKNDLANAQKEIKEMLSRINS